MKVRFTDSGEIITVNSEVDLVDYMRGTSKVHYRSNNDYMKAFAIRAVEWSNLDIRATNEKDFVRDLKSSNLITCDL